MSEEIEPLLALLQLSDSALPIGGYSHSWGLETWIQKDTIKDACSAEEAIKILMAHSIATQDGIACGIAYRICQKQDFETLDKLNQHLTATKWPEEIYQASTRLGQRLLRLAGEANFVKSQQGLDSYIQKRKQSPVPGKIDEDYHHSVIFGWLSACAGVPETAAVSAFLQNSSNCLISSCVRLIPLGHTDGQKIAVRLRPLIARLTEQSINKNIDDISAFAPMHEAACVDHESLYSRLFQS